MARRMGSMTGILAWMGRPDVVLAVSILALVLSLISLALTIARDKQ